MRILVTTVLAAAIGKLFKYFMQTRVLLEMLLKKK